MFRTSTDETKKQKPTTRGGPRGFPIQLLCLTSVIGREPAYSAWYSGRRKMTRLKRTFRRPLRDEKRGRYSFIHFWHMTPSHDKEAKSIRFPFPLPSSNTQLHGKEFVYTLISSWQRPTNVVKCVAELFGG